MRRHKKVECIITYVEEKVEQRLLLGGDVG